MRTVPLYPTSCETEHMTAEPEEKKKKKKEWSRTHSRQLAHISSNRSAPRTHFNTHYWDRFSMIHRIRRVIYHQPVVGQEFITPLECKSSFENKASVCEAMPSLDGHLVNWVSLFKEGISIWANQGRSPQHLSHTEPCVLARKWCGSFWGQMSVLSQLLFFFFPSL